MQAPVVAVGDGALGFWAALRDVWPRNPRPARLGPQGRQRLEALPKSVLPTAKKMLADIRDAEHAVAAAQRFDAEFRAEAADKVTTGC